MGTCCSTKTKKDENKILEDKLKDYISNVKKKTTKIEFEKQTGLNLERVDKNYNLKSFKTDVIIEEKDNNNLNFMIKFDNVKAYHSKLHYFYIQITFFGMNNDMNISHIFNSTLFEEEHSNFSKNEKNNDQVNSNSQTSYISKIIKIENFDGDSTSKKNYISLDFNILTYVSKSISNLDSNFMEIVSSILFRILLNQN